MQKIEMIVEKTKTGYCSHAAKYPVYTVAHSLPELKKNIQEALNLYFEDDGVVITENDVKITMDIPQFFEYYKVLNTQELSDRIGINQSLLSEYITGTKKPSVAQTLSLIHISEAHETDS